MRAAVFRGPQAPLSIETVPDPVPAADQVVIEVVHAGICGSDLHMAESEHTASGLILGHEYAGTIAELGSGVSGSWKVGDRVTALPLFACHRADCAACSADLPAICPANLFAGTDLLAQGAYAQLVGARAAMVQRLPDGVSFAEGAMVEPLAVGHHIVSRAESLRDAAVLVLGGGPIGVAVALFAALAGARHVIVSERSPERRALAVAMGAGVIDPAAGDVGEAFARLTGGQPQVVFECVGVPGMLAQAVSLVAIRGQVIVAGVIIEQDTFLPIVALGKEVTIRYSQAYAERDFEAVIDAIARGRIAPAPIHTSTVSLDALPAAFAALRGNPRECKVLISPA